jgi:O-antigen ligase
LIFGAALMLLAASARTERGFQWAGVALLALACAPWRSLPVNLLSLAVIPYAAWQLSSAVFLSPVYAAEGIYQPLVLLAAYVAFSGLGRERATELFGAGVALAAGMVLLGLLQHYVGLWQVDLPVLRFEDNPVRAAATFVTPNSFATVVGMFLAPLASLYVVGGGRRRLALALWLFAGLVVSQSRGGMLAFAVGLAFAGLSLGPAIVVQRKRRCLQLVAGFTMSWLAVVMADAITFGGSGGVERLANDAWVARGVAERPDLYAATIRLAMEHPFLGAGANMFFPLFEAVKPAQLWDAVYFYSHNDYLQTWLEFGVPGLALLLALAATALVTALRSFRRSPDDAFPLVCGSALAVCFAHAMVDFPLYIPFILLLVGAFLGAFTAHAGGGASAWASWIGARAAVPSNPVRWAIAVAALAWLFQPVFAELAHHRSRQLLARGEVRDALYWQSVARRLEPRHPAHYQAEAMIWRAQAILTKNPALAAQADALFEQGARVNPYDVGNLIGRSELHRRHRDLLAAPAPPAQVLAWSERAAQLRPLVFSVQAEYVRTLAFAGEREQARKLARALLEQYPQLDFARRLAAEVQG